MGLNSTPSSGSGFDITPSPGRSFEGAPSSRRGTVTVVTGPAHCGKTTRLLSRYRLTVSEEIGSAIWLAPTQRAALAVRRRILDDLPACLAPGVMTFDQFAASVLRASTSAGRAISTLQKR